MNDSEIVNKFLKGDITVFNAIVDEHTKFVYHICASILKNQHDSEDITQEVFLLVYKNLHKFKHTSSLKTWIYKITYNECLKFLKRKRIKIELDDEGSAIADEQEINHNENEDVMLKVLEQSIVELKPIESMIINLFYHKEQSLNEICEITNLSNNNIRVILHRSRVKLVKIINAKLNQHGK